MTRRALPLLAGAAALLAGCMNLAPRYERPDAPLPAGWPADSADAAAAATGAASGPDPRLDAAAVASLGWRDFVTDPKLRDTLALALANNRDLRIAALNIERARAQFEVQGAAALPTVNATGSATQQGQPASLSSTGQARTLHQYNAQLALASYELDFFGRVRNLSDAALQSFFATEHNRRSAQISLVADTATAWLTLAADRQRLALAQQTLKAREETYRLTRRAFELGGQSGLTLLQVQTTVDSARADVAAYTAQARQSLNALNLLAGAPVPEVLLPEQPVEAPVVALVAVPAALPSSVLQQRPDVMAAERLLEGSHASIGAARAAFFPRITLTGSAGVASNELSQLFAGGGGAWSFVPSISLPIFTGGLNQANLRTAEVQRDIQLASYEKTLQVAFREVADALAQRGTLGERLAAQRSLTEASARSLALSQARFRSGADSYLEVLDAQRTLYTAQQTLINLQLAEQANRLVLYRVLGGGWKADSA